MPILITFLRSLIIFCVCSFAKSEIIGDLRVCAIRVSFLQDSALSTTGNGNFLTENLGVDCGTYTIDPAPHDKQYFESQIKAVDSYFRSVSYGAFGINIEESTVYPSGQNSSYILENHMNFYNPYDTLDVQEERLTILFHDALSVAYSNGVDLKNYDLVVVFHAGIGQDFSLPFLDPTPEDLPSTFIDQKMIEKYYGLSHLNFGESQINKGILLPETQNHLLFDIAENMFSDASNPCEYQYGLTGTFSLMIGFAIGLPPLWNIDTGASGIGVFGLMDQGSNNGRGLIPSPPNPWTRIFAGWESPLVPQYSTTLSLPSRSENKILKIPINDDEYFLIENRNNKVDNKISLDSIRVLMSVNNEYPPYIEVLFDSSGCIKDQNGVITSMPNYDVGLPASGLLIWHIDEAIINTKIDDYSINNNLENLGIDLEEADGAQDIGYSSIFLFNDISSGYFGDLWFNGNLQYELANPYFQGSKPSFSHNTIPSTMSNDGSKSFLTIANISAAKDTMQFEISNSLFLDGFPNPNSHIRTVLDINNDGLLEYVGGQDSLYVETFLLNDSNSRRYFHEIISDDLDIAITFNNGISNIHILERKLDSSYYSEYSYNINEETFALESENIIDSTVFSIVVDNNYEFKSKSDWEVFSKRVFGNTNSFGIDINLSGIQVDNFGETFTKWKEYNFTYIAGIDIDLDSRLDIIALDKEGRLHVFNHNLIALSGFPTTETFVPPILAGNILGDDYVEIIGKTNDSTSIIIFSNKGDELFNLSSGKQDKLICLSSINDKNTLITNSSVYTFDLKTNINGNIWSFWNGNQNNERAIFLSPSDTSFLEDKILNRSYVYPNPIKDGSGTIRIESNNAKSINLKIFDLMGVEVANFNKDLTECCLQINEWVWDTSRLDPGVFFGYLTVSNQEKRSIKILKIAVMR